VSYYQIKQKQAQIISFEGSNQPNTHRFNQQVDHQQQQCVSNEAIKDRKLELFQ
jgi:hypothetical protein